MIRFLRKDNMMLYIYTALYIEAKPLIEYFRLKRDMDEPTYQIFLNDRIILIIGGTGMIKSAVSCTYVLTKYKAGRGNFFLNVGFAGCKNRELEIGSVILCNKIIDAAKNNYYPDILFKHDFTEGTLYTSIKQADSIEDFKDEDVLLCDMEGASVFNSAKIFFPLHKICILKIVSDHITSDGDVESARIFDKEQLLEVMRKNIQKIFGMINFFLEYKENDECVFSAYEKKSIDNISKNMRLTKSMRIEFEKSAKYYKLNNADFDDILLKYADISSLTKDEVRRNFFSLKQEFTQ